MPRIPLPPGCAGFADGNRKYFADKPGGHISLEDGSPQLRKLRNQDYAAAGLVDAGPEKFFVTRGPEGRWCPHCPDNTIRYSWTRTCPSCGGETVPESEMARKLPEGPYKP